MRWEYWRLQLERLQDVCFACGRYVHCKAGCPLKSSDSGGVEAGNDQLGQKTQAMKQLMFPKILRVRGSELG